VIVEFRDARDFKYYLYVSTAKIDMLYDQMYKASKHSHKKLLSVNAKIVSATFESSTEKVVGRDEKLKAVEDELSKRELVGTPNDPKDYFKGIMRMRWGLFDDCGTRPEDEPPLVYFGGFEKTLPLVVGLGGSSKHVVGHEGATSTYSRSCTPVIVKWLFSGLKYGGPPELPAWWDKGAEESELSSAVAVALHYLRPPTQDLEFLAKTLWTGRLYGHEHLTGVLEARVVLGTPLYVAQSHPMPDEVRFGLDKEW
jgi:hypothetical protein